MTTWSNRRKMLAASLVSGVFFASVAVAEQAVSPADDDERMDNALRNFGHVSGQAFQCAGKDAQVKLERTALDVATNVMRLFGSDQAFFFAAAFGAGASETLDSTICPEVTKQAAEMVGKLKVLSSR